MPNNAAKVYFKRLLKSKMRAARDKGRKFRVPRQKKPPRPLNIQKEYTRQLDAIVSYIRHLFRTMVYPKLPAIVDKAQAHRPKKDALVRDAGGWSDDVDHTMNNVEIEFEKTYSPIAIGKIARDTGKKINKFNQSIHEYQIKTLVGTTIFETEPWLHEEMAAFVKENVGLITKWSDELKTRAEEIIMRGARNGTNPDEISQQLEARIGVVGSRYDMIARDQTSKFNGQLSMLRNVNLGIERYTWNTSHDERVRPSHAELDGEVFEYADPPVTNEEGDVNNPGEDYNCVPEECGVSLHSSAKKAFRRWHSGELTEIVTDAKEPLRVTPNHPVLTTRGWVPAHLLKVGDYLIEATFQDIKGSITNPERGDILAKEIFGSFKNVGLQHRVPGRASWFHGDSGREEIDVIEINRHLLFDKMASKPQGVGNDILARPPQPTLAKSHLSSSRITSAASADGVMRSAGQTRPFRNAGIFHPQEHRVAAVANGNTVLDQDLSDRRSGNIESLSDSLLARSVVVEPDYFMFRKVKRIRIKQWSGWVHNFETMTGWFSSVNLIIQNCRCADIPYVEDIVGDLDDTLDEEDQEDAAAQEEADQEELNPGEE